MNTLTEIANNLKLDKGTIIPNDGGNHGPRLHFTTIYDIYFFPLKNIKLNILEIGISNGNSLKLWETYFPNSNIFGIDIIDCKKYETQRIKTFIADQSNKEQLNEIGKNYGPFDIIIDDGSHVVSHQQISFATLFPFCSNMYWIEDLHTSDNIWQGKLLYGNDMSFKQGDSTIDFIKRIQEEKFESNFLNEKELQYIKENLKICKVFNLPLTSYGENKLCLFVKKF